MKPTPQFNFLKNYFFHSGEMLLAFLLFLWQSITLLRMHGTKFSESGAVECQTNKGGAPITIPSYFLKLKITNKVVLKQKNKNFFCVITIDRSFKTID